MIRPGVLLADGRTSKVYRYGRDGAVKVLEPSTPQHWADAEAAFTAAVGALGVSAPDVRDVIEVDGRAAIVYGRVDGPSMWQRMLERPGDVGALTAEMVSLQRAIHAAGVPHGLPALAERLREKLGRAEELSNEERSTAITLLESMPCGAALLHGDLHPGNILLSDRGPIVIDWFDATVGHPTADIARSALLVRSSGATDLRHLPDAPNDLVAAVHDAYLDEVGESPGFAQWLRLRAAGRLAERADLDSSGLVALWRLGSARDDD